MFPTLKKYIESKKATPQTGLTIADYVLDSKVLTEADFTFIDVLYQENKVDQPFKGIRVLFNMHQDRATWLLMLYYQSLGAQVEASNLNLSELPFAKSALEASAIPYHQNQVPSAKTRTYYHHVVDCGAGMLAAFDPKYGMSELTQTLPNLYSTVRFPVITVNAGVAKETETRYGTGKGGLSALPSGFVQLLTANLGNSNTALTDEDKLAVYEKRFKSKFHVIIGGNGKVGRGYARALIQMGGVQPDHILLVDTKAAHSDSDVADVPCLVNEQGMLIGIGDKTAFMQGILHHMQRVSPSSNYTIADFAKDIALVTATGMDNLLSNNGYSPADFHAYTWFINMGQPDEYGWNFPDDCMIGKTKRSVNFHRAWLMKNGFATETRYLMPSFCALAESTKYVIQAKRSSGLQALPIEIDEKMILLAIQTYGEEFQPMLPLLQERKREVAQSPSLSTSSSGTSSTRLMSPPVSPSKNIPSKNEGVSSTYHPVYLRHYHTRSYNHPNHLPFTDKNNVTGKKRGLDFTS